MRRHFFGTAVAVAATALAIGCAANQPPAARAARVVRTQCEPGESTQQDEQMVRSTRVLRVDPVYSHVLTSNNNAEDRVNGAKLLVRPPAGVSAEQMTRTLQCHGARVLLGEANAQAIANDPYWLPDSWVNIDVRPENGNFAITLSADTVRESLQVLGRAHRFGDQQMATQPELP